MGDEVYRTDFFRGQHLITEARVVQGVGRTVFGPAHRNAELALQHLPHGLRLGDRAAFGAAAADQHRQARLPVQMRRVAQPYQRCAQHSVAAVFGRVVILAAAKHDDGAGVCRDLHRRRRAFPRRTFPLLQQQTRGQRHRQRVQGDQSDAGQHGGSARARMAQCVAGGKNQQQQARGQQQSSQCVGQLPGQHLYCNLLFVKYFIGIVGIPGQTLSAVRKFDTCA